MRRVLLAVGVLFSTAVYANDTLPARGLDNDPGEALQILGETHSCAARGGSCIWARAGTKPLESQPVAALKRSSAVVPRFARADGSAPWSLELASTLKRQALAGNAIFLFFDLDDPDALANKEFTAMFQTAIHPGRVLGAKLRLSTEDGFRAGRTYRLRVVQLIGDREQVLLETDFTLL